MSVELALLLLGAYLLGAIPFGVFIARAKGVDIMSVGSGNIGATNVMREVGKAAGYAVFALDLLKGLIPALAARLLFPGRQDLWFLVGITAIFGHSFSPFLKFKGGKGISTALGMLLGVSTFTAFSAFGVFAVLLSTVRYMSVASMIAAAVTIPFGFLYRDSPWVIGGYGLMTAFIVYRHRANIKRLRAGTEPKFRFGKSSKDVGGTRSQEPGTRDQGLGTASQASTPNPLLQDEPLGGGGETEPSPASSQGEAGEE